MAEEDNVIIEDSGLAMEDVKTSSDEEDYANSPLIRFVQERYSRAKDYRNTDEDRWLSAYRNYRGLYGQDIKFTDAEKCRTFIKVTKTKTLAAYGQIVDVLFAGQKFPLSIEPTILPEGVTANVTFDPSEPEQLKEMNPYGHKDDGKELPPGSTLNNLELGVLEEKLEGIDVKEGIGRTPTSATFSPAMIAAKKMEKKIMDQLEESNASKHLRSTAFEMALFGTGIIKGPFAVNK